MSEKISISYISFKKMISYLGKTPVGGKTLFVCFTLSEDVIEANLVLTRSSLFFTSIALFGLKRLFQCTYDDW